MTDDAIVAKGFLFAALIKLELLDESEIEALCAEMRDKMEPEFLIAFVSTWWHACNDA